MNNEIEKVENSQKDAEGYQEKSLSALNGFVGVAIHAVIVLLSAVLLIFGIVLAALGLTISVGVVGLVMSIIGAIILTAYISAVWFFHGFVIVKPNEAAVMLKFGKYVGTIKKEGFFFTNPFAKPFNPARTFVFDANSMKRYTGSRNVSLKQITLDNQKQKVNDEQGNPIEIGVVVIWQIKDTAKATFNVENYVDYVSIQADASIRTIARQYPYDDVNDNDTVEKSLRGSAVEVAEALRVDLQARLVHAGIDIVEARISHLAYAPEIAAAMLQRQQAQAIVDARRTIVEGAVGMVELALEKLKESGAVELDEERKAQMVSNLMVVLCSSKETQPIINTGTLY